MASTATIVSPAPETSATCSARVGTRTVPGESAPARDDALAESDRTTFAAPEQASTASASASGSSVGVPGGSAARRASSRLGLRTVTPAKRRRSGILGSTTTGTPRARRGPRAPATTSA
jgi:hypothetical protein